MYTAQTDCAAWRVRTAGSGVTVDGAPDAVDELKRCTVTATR
jgi:hypothetical protein